MANRRGRRKRQRQLQEAGPRVPLKPPSSPPTPKSASDSWWTFWKRIPSWVYALLVAFSIVITLLEGYPWLSVEESTFVDPQNPFSQMFKLKNGGYIPVTNLDAYCNPTFHASGIRPITVRNNTIQFIRFADYLAHDGSVTIPCFKIPNIFKQESPGPIANNSSLTIEITYAFFSLDVSWLRRSQKFKFVSITGADGTQHWIFKS